MVYRGYQTEEESDHLLGQFNGPDMNADLDVQVNYLGQVSAPHKYFWIYYEYFFQKQCECRNYIRVDSVDERLLVGGVWSSRLLQEYFASLVDLRKN